MKDNTAHECPKFNFCSAPICPLDNQWPERNHLKGERSCYLLRQIAKQNGRPQKIGTISQEVLHRIGQDYPQILSSKLTLAKTLEKASALPVRAGFQVR